MVSLSGCEAWCWLAIVEVRPEPESEPARRFAGYQIPMVVIASNESEAKQRFEGYARGHAFAQAVSFASLRCVTSFEGLPEATVEMIEDARRAGPGVVFSGPRLAWPRKRWWAFWKRV